MNSTSSRSYWSGPDSFPRPPAARFNVARARQLQLTNELDAIAAWTNSASDVFDRSAGTAELLRGKEDIQFWLTNRISQRMGISPQHIGVKVPFTSLGLTSLAAVQIAGELEVCLGEPVSPTLVYDYPTIEKLARHLAGLDAEDRLEGLTTEQWPEPIAIVGIGCRLPGSPNPSAYWDLIRHGRDALREMPDWRWGNGAEPLKAEFPALTRGGAPGQRRSVRPGVLRHQRPRSRLDGSAAADVTSRWSGKH